MIRRVVTLAWAVTGLCRKGTVRLSAWAEEVTSAAHYAASWVRRFARFLHNPAINPAQWYPPLLRLALIDRTPGMRAYVALDTTVLAAFVLIRASLVYRGRARELAWRALRRTSAMVSFDAYQIVLDQMRAIIPEGVDHYVAGRSWVLARTTHSVCLSASVALSSPHNRGYAGKAARASDQSGGPTASPWDRDLSYLKLGWRWLNQQYRRGWWAFRAFWLDPAPDPELLHASRRQAALPK